MNLKEQRAAAMKAAQGIVDAAKAAGRDLTQEEVKAVDEHVVEIKSVTERMEQARASAKAFAAIGALGDDEALPERKDGASPELSLGEHFVKHAGSRLGEVRGQKGATVAVPEWMPGRKAAGDTHVIGSIFQTPVLTQFDRTIVQAVRPRLVIADLLGSGTLSGNAISYFVEGALEGAFTTVAEGAAKPQLHFVDPTMVTDALKKIAGFIKLTDEMTEDLDFYVSEINGRLLYELARLEEVQLLNGNGTGTNVLGLMNRSGVQTETTGTVVSGDTTADAIFRGMTKVSTGSGLDPDGVAINPTDYQTLRLGRDGNGQYFGGGYFQNEYGNGGMPMQPPIWGLRTVVTPAMPVGMALVGAFGQAATVYRKGGVRVESTNSHESDFTSNLVTVRAEERVALAVRRPAAFVKVTLTPAA